MAAEQEKLRQQWKLQLIGKASYDSKIAAKTRGREKSSTRAEKLRQSTWLKMLKDLERNNPQRA